MPDIHLAGCVILDKLGRILLLHRIQTDWYELPGGKYDPEKDGEAFEDNFEATAKRELLEELLCNVRIIRKLGKHEFEEDNQILMYHWYLAEAESQPRINESKFDWFEYVAFSDLDQYKLSQNMRNLYEQIKFLE